MDWIVALVLMIGSYYILELYFKHREKMAQLNPPDKKDRQ